MTDAQIDKLLAVFDGGLVKVADPKNARGYTVRYLPREAMRAVIAAVRSCGDYEPNRGEG